MKVMPAALKKKIRQLQRAYEKAGEIEREVADMIESYGVDPQYFDACKTDDKFTEALAFVTNSEGNVEENIKDIEEVFLYHVNKTSNP